MKRIKVLMSKVGIDGHERGVLVVITALKEAGMEVIYTGPFQKIEQVVEAAIQEDVDVIGVSTLAGDYFLVSKMMVLLRKRCGEKKLVVVGGIVPVDAEKTLKEAGVAEVFRPGARIDEICNFIKSAVNRGETPKN